MTNSEQYERTINYNAVFILSFCIIGIIFIWGMRYYTRLKIEESHKDFALQNIQKASDYLMKHGKISFYQIYLNREELGLRLVDFASEYHRPTYRKASSYELPRKIPHLSEKEFTEICCFVLEYDKTAEKYKLYTGIIRRFQGCSELKKKRLKDKTRMAGCYVNIYGKYI